MALVPRNREQEEIDREAGVIRNDPFGGGNEFGEPDIPGITRPTPFGAGGTEGIQIDRGSGFGRAGTGRGGSRRIRRPQSRSGGGGEFNRLASAIARATQGINEGVGGAVPARKKRGGAFNTGKETFDFGAPKGVFTNPRGTFTNKRGTFVDDPSRFNRGSSGGRSRRRFHVG